MEGKKSSESELELEEKLEEKRKKEARLRQRETIAQRAAARCNSSAATTDGRPAKCLSYNGATGVAGARPRRQLVANDWRVPLSVSISVSDSASREQHLSFGAVTENLVCSRFHN